MKPRVLAAAIAASLMLPMATAAQLVPLQDDPFWAPRLRITPFVGHLAALTRTEEWMYDTETQSGYVQADVDIAGGTGIGVNVETPFRGQFGLTGAVAYVPRGETLARVRQTEELIRYDGNNVLLGRFGVALHLFEEESELMMRRMGASLFAGGTLMHEWPRNAIGTAEVLSSGTHLGVNLGFAAELPFASDRLALQAGLENNIMWWDEDPIAAVAYEYFGQPGTSREQTTGTTGASQAWLARVGVSIRLR